jgi:hypothetical protein
MANFAFSKSRRLAGLSKSTLLTSAVIVCATILASKGFELWERKHLASQALYWMESQRHPDFCANPHDFSYPEATTACFSRNGYDFLYGVDKFSGTPSRSIVKIRPETEFPGQNVILTWSYDALVKYMRLDVRSADDLHDLFKAIPEINAEG